MAESSEQTVIPTRETLRKERAEDIAGWFKDHTATLHTVELNGAAVESLRWSKPGSSNCRIDYLAHSRHLFVTGDLGEAVYAVYSPASLEWWAKCDIGYFAGKCMASEHGRGYKSFSSDSAKVEIAEIIADDSCHDEPGTLAKKFTEADGPLYPNFREEWTEWLHSDGYGVLGSDYYEYGNVGMAVDMRCEAHLAGLKLALASATPSSAVTA